MGCALCEAAAHAQADVIEHLITVARPPFSRRALGAALMQLVSSNQIAEARARQDEAEALVRKVTNRLEREEARLERAVIATEHEHAKQRVARAGRELQHTERRLEQARAAVGEVGSHYNRSVRALVRAGARKGTEAAAAAAARGFLDILRELVMCGGGGADGGPIDRAPALAAACARHGDSGCEEVVRWLLSRQPPPAGGGGVDRLDDALLAAAKAGSLRLVQLLLGFDPDELRRRALEGSSSDSGGEGEGEGAARAKTKKKKKKKKRQKKKKKDEGRDGSPAGDEAGGPAVAGAAGAAGGLDVNRALLAAYVALEQVQDAGVETDAEHEFVIDFLVSTGAEGRGGPAQRVGKAAHPSYARLVGDLGKDADRRRMLQERKERRRALRVQQEAEAAAEAERQLAALRAEQAEEAEAEAKRATAAARVARQRRRHQEQLLATTAKTLPQMAAEGEAAERARVAAALRDRAARFQRAKKKDVKAVLSEMREGIDDAAVARRRALAARAEMYRSEKPRDGLYTLAVAHGAALRLHKKATARAHERAHEVFKRHKLRADFLPAELKTSPRIPRRGSTG
eukprot:g1888.t1